MELVIPMGGVNNIDLKPIMISVANIGEFLGAPGREHYRLLSYLSSLFNGANIIDIGTHQGASALALSMNSSNTVHSFDIIDSIGNRVPSAKTRENIKLYIDDVFSPEGREKHRDLLLSSPLIFIDVDPHNGTMEYDIYCWLRDEAYQGIVIFDDIHHFQGMRELFWSRIDPPCKVDLTSHGHWSGTGLVSFIPRRVLVSLNV